MSADLELLILKQDMRAIADTQRVLSGLVDALIDDDDLKTQQIRDLETTKRALTASCVRLFEESERYAAERDALLKVIERYGLAVTP